MKIIPFELCLALTGAKVLQRGNARGPREVLRWIHLPESVVPQLRIVYVDRDGILHLTAEDGLYMPQPVAGRIESPEDLVLRLEDANQPSRTDAVGDSFEEELSIK